LSVAEMLPPNAAFPEYVAMMTCDPACPNTTAMLATPLEFRVALPIRVPLFVNVIVPAGVPEVLVTLAVNVTECPTSDGLSEEIRAVAVGARLTV
jgi:hypothetical protein